MIVDFYEIGTIADEKLDYAVMGTLYKGKNVIVRHKDRKTWEIPGGHRELGESIEEAGRRELMEETGAYRFSLTPLCEYSVRKDGKTSFGRLFTAEIDELGQLSLSEIEEVKLFDALPSNLTYPDIQPFLHRKVLELRVIR